MANRVRTCSRAALFILALFPILAAFLCLNPPGRAADATSSRPWLDTSQPVPQRVDALIGQMTLEEKVGQMMTDAPAIPRLGIPAYYWWSECLHGNANAGVATVFPQAIGLAATFDLGLHRQVAIATADEDRAKYNETVRQNTPLPFRGATFFSPNINIFRDPRWGRGQETYGEDPYLTARFGVEFVKGLQGDDPNYLKVVATPKHYAVHSGPEPERHVFNAMVSMYDLNDTYLPAFEATVRDAHAQSVMGAYSSLYGEPACASPLLLNYYLRNQWGFDGYVVSDCGAISDIYTNHHYANSMPEAAALAVKAGCDLACDGAYSALVPAVRQGFIAEADIDKAVKRLFTERFRLGMFDPPEKVAYARIPMSVVNSPENSALAARAARESMVLLKNQDGFLPLKPGIRSLAVIGPNADSVRVLVGNYNGEPAAPVTVLAGIEKRAAQAGVTVEYVKGTGLTGSEVDNTTPIPATDLRSNGQPGVTAEYWSNEDLSGAPAATRRDERIDFRYTDGPAPGIPNTHFSARWTGEIVPPVTGRYALAVRGDDGFRLTLGGKTVIEDWTIHPARTQSYEVDLKAGQAVPFQLDYYQGEGQAEVSLRWHLPEPETSEPFADALAAARRSDAVIYVCGITAQLEGEEGTNGNGDRKDLNLPGQQEGLLEALHRTGKPIVVVLMNGSALGTTWAQDHVPAVLEAWYPGQDGGTAVAGALFGDYSPAGRLPVTFYRSVDDIPPFRDYAMKGRTYKYFTGTPLYPFGFGLSYTTFRYSNLRVDKAEADRQVGVTVSVDVENTGGRDSDEVAELYLRPAPEKRESERVIAPDQPMPRLELAGFQRIHLRAGEKRTLTFTVAPQQLLLVNAQGQRALQPGTWQVYVGGEQPNLRRLQPGVVSARVSL